MLLVGSLLYNRFGGLAPLFYLYRAFASNCIESIQFVVKFPVVVFSLRLFFIQSDLLFVLQCFLHHWLLSEPPTARSLYVFYSHTHKNAVF